VDELPRLVTVTREILVKVLVGRANLDLPVRCSDEQGRVRVLEREILVNRAPVEEQRPEAVPQRGPPELRGEARRLLATVREDEHLAPLEGRLLLQKRRRLRARWLMRELLVDQRVERILPFGLMVLDGAPPDDILAPAAIAVVAADAALEKE